MNWIGPKLDRESALYGSLSVSFVVLGWLYVIGRLLVAVPFLNSALLEHREARSAPAETRACTPRPPIRSQLTIDAKWAR